MVFSSKQRSYAAHAVKRIVILLLMMGTFSATAQTSTPRLATSSSAQQSSAVIPANVSPTPTVLFASSTVGPSQPQNVSFQISITLLKTTWSGELLDSNSSEYVALAKNITTAVSDAVQSAGSARVELVEFKPGSVIAVLEVTALNTQKDAVESKLQTEMQDGKLGNFEVDPTPYSGSLFDAVLKVKTPCDEGFNQSASLMNAVSNAMSSQPGFLNATVKNIDCPDPQNITLVTVRVQINNPATSNPDQELKPLKDAVDSGQVGNFSVVPEWKTFIPGEKLFYIHITLVNQSCDEAQTRQSLENFVKNDFNNTAEFVYSNVQMDECKTAVIAIGMTSSASELPSKSLQPLANDYPSGKFGNVEFSKPQIRAVIDPESLTRKIFQTTFRQMVPSCQNDQLNDANSLHYKNLSEGIKNYVDLNMKKNQKYIAVKVTRLSCINTTMVVSVSDVYLQPNATDKFNEVGTPLFRCKFEPGIYEWGLKIIVKTPTVPQIKVGWAKPFVGPSAHLVCYKPKPPTSKPTPTTQPQTTEPQNTTTGTTTTKNVSTSEPETVPTSKPLITEATLPPLDKTPTLFVKLKLGMTWGEFCSKLEDTLKQRIAGNLYDKNGARVSPDRIVFVNVRRNCADPSKKDEQAEVWFYVSKKSGSKELHKCLTLKAYKLFKMFFDNGNTKPLGPEFEGKLVHVELAGNNASKYENDDDDDKKMSTMAIILIAVAGAVGLFLMLLACCCLFCCGAKRRRRRKYEQPHQLHVVHVDGDGVAGSGAKGKGKNSGKDDHMDGKDGGKKLKGDDGKHGRKNDGYDSDGKQNKEAKDADSKESDNQLGDKSKLSADDRNHSNADDNHYVDLKGANGVGDHTYASLGNKGSDNKSNAGKVGGNQGNSGNQGNENKSGAGKLGGNQGNDGNLANDNKSGVGKLGSNQGNDNKSNGGKFGGAAPVIVTSSMPDVNSNNGGGKMAGSASSSPGGSRRGSSSTGAEGQGGASKTPSSPGLRQKDADLHDRERRRSSVPSIIDDEDVPLTHKTGTVGIVGLALRNKNEKKKETEFKNLSKDVPNEEVKYPSNTASKNRSPDVLPAPRTRVKLSTSPDYINANWIRDHKGKRCYIATQHPLHETMEDFWRMTWDQQATVVVMVNEEEKEKPADFNDYLPKGEGNTKTFGGIEITIKQITEKPDYTLTVLNIAESKNRASTREVSHFRFTSWKERAMPNVALFVGFVTATREARRQIGDSSAPVVVHCSDGLGFSGVYVAVDIGIKSHEESKTSVVDVFDLCKNLRLDRHGIICSLDQYNFIYQALYEYTVNYDPSAE